MENLRPQETEIKPEEKELFHGFESKVISPLKPLVPTNEGTHLRIIPDTEITPYFEEGCDIKKTIRPFLTALATARAMFGDPSEKDEYYYWNQWVNVHLIPRFGGKSNFQIEVIGRNARGDTWAEPVEYPKLEEYDQFLIVREEQEMLEQMIPKKAQEVAVEAAGATLFDDNKEYEAKEKTIFSFQNFEIMMPTENPHVEEGGLHLWVHANDRGQNEGVQSNVKNGLEQFIISEAIAKVIYKELGVPIEIHFSGNWGLPTHHQEEESVAKGEDPSGNYYGENLSAHANLYGAPPETDRADLPPRPAYERPAMPEETREKVRLALEKSLPHLLDAFLGKKVMDITS
jgi:hypothetical protein